MFFSVGFSGLTFLWEIREVGRVNNKGVGVCGKGGGGGRESVSSPSFRSVTV